MITHSRFKRFLKLDTLNNQIQGFFDIEKSLKEVNSTLDGMAMEFTNRNSTLNSVVDSDEYSDRIKGVAKSKYESFVKSYQVDFFEESKKRNDLIRKRENLLEDPTISKAVKDLNILKAAKTNYKSGKISLPVYNSIIKAKTKGPVKYSDFILFNEEGKILLTQRSSMDDNKPGEWCIPGGHVDPGEDHKTAAIRELKEETNMSVDNADLVGEFKDSNAEIEYYQGYINSQEQQIVLEDSETHHYEWVDPYKDLDKFKLIFDQKENIEKVLGIQNASLNVVKIKKAFIEGRLSVTLAKELIEKAKGVKNDKVSKVMSEFKDGTLKTSSGKVVTDRQQALTIALSEVNTTKTNHQEPENKKEVPSFISKLKDLFTKEGEYSEYKNRIKLKDIQFWPQGLDLENCEIVDIDKDFAVYRAGGDWQNPMYVKVHLDKDDSDKPEDSKIRVAAVYDKYKSPTSAVLKKKKKELDFAKSETENDIKKAVDLDHLKEMIEEHKRLISLLKKYSDKKDISKELSTQELELESYEKQLEEINEKSEKADSLFKSGLISESLHSDLIEKARSGKYADTAANRKLKRVGQAYGSVGKKEEIKPEKDAKKEEVSEPKKQTPEELTENAKNASVGQLETAIKESNDPEVRQAAHNELDRREKEEKPKEEGEEKFGEPKKEEVASEKKKEESKPEDEVKENDSVFKYIQNSSSMSFFLRKGKPSKYSKYDEKEMKKMAIDMDKAFEPAITDMTTYRGLSSYYDVFDKPLDEIKVGDEITDKGFVSTSKDKNVAESFRDGDVVMEISVNKGDNVIYGSDYADEYHQDQKEIILPRNSKFKVGSFDGNILKVSVQKDL